MLRRLKKTSTNEFKEKLPLLFFSPDSENQRGKVFTPSKDVITFEWTFGFGILNRDDEQLLGLADSSNGARILMMMP